jgi:hypothetical protein
VKPILPHFAELLERRTEQIVDQCVHVSKDASPEEAAGAQRARLFETLCRGLNGSLRGTGEFGWGQLDQLQELVEAIGVGSGIRLRNACSGSNGKKR